MEIKIKQIKTGLDLPNQLEKKRLIIKANKRAKEGTQTILMSNGKRSLLTMPSWRRIRRYRRLPTM